MQFIIGASNIDTTKTASFPYEASFKGNVTAVQKPTCKIGIAMSVISIDMNVSQIIILNVHVLCYMKV